MGMLFIMAFGVVIRLVTLWEVQMDPMKGEVKFEAMLDAWCEAIPDNYKLRVSDFVKGAIAIGRVNHWRPLMG